MDEESIISEKGPTFRLMKDERLCSKKLIQEIFEKGTVVYAHPLKIYYIANECSFNRILITVPKRNYKKAVDRNLLKRRIREAFRLCKPYVPETVPHDAVYADIAVVYISNEILEFQQICNKINNVLAKIRKGLEAKNSIDS